MIIMRARIAHHKAAEKAKRGNLSLNPEIGLQESSNNQSMNGDALVGGYDTLGSGFGWMSQPQFDKISTGRDSMGGMSGGMGSSDMAMMGQDTNWSMWDDFMQPGVPGFDIQGGEQKFYE
jgi:hypothetical protein